MFWNKLHILTFFIGFIFLFLCACVTTQQAANQNSKVEILEPENQITNQTVVLLHGLSRTSRSMRPMANALQSRGYKVCNINYPSRYFSVKKLASHYVLPRIKDCIGKAKTTHFVTHSLGGIIIRQLDTELQDYSVGKIVMLSPPNQGSEAVDVFSKVWGFETITGPAGSSLGTDENSVPNSFPIPSIPFGIIAAKYSNSFMSWLIPGDDDGKVALKRMKLKGMKDFIVTKNTHSFMMRDPKVIDQVEYFLQHANFKHVDL